MPQNIAIDQSDDVWITNAYGDSVTELDDQGMALSGTHGYSGGGLQSPGGIAIDGAGTVWVTNFGNDSLTEFIGIAARRCAPRPAGRRRRRSVTGPRPSTWSRAPGENV